MTHRQVRSPQDAQRGVAALIVVMLLFFVVSLAAAYGSRNLIFEQRTSGNQARSTLAFEAAEAGVEWALSQLNGGTANDSCDPTAAAAISPPAQSFQQRYLAIDLTPGGTQGYVQQTPRPTGTPDLSPRMWPTCVFNGTTWSCACPGTTAADPTPPTGNAQFPAFRVWAATLQSSPTVTSPWDPPASPRPGFLPLTSIGCTRLPTAAETAAGSPTCLDFSPQGQPGEGQAELRTMLALRSGLGVPPAAAITARLDFVPDPASGAANVKVINTEVSSGGYTINTGSALVATKVTAESLPGTPGAESYADNDARLANFATVSSVAGSATAPKLTAGERMFVSVFGMKRQTYRNQTGLRVCQSPCSAAAINTLLANNPNRIIWVDGELELENNARVGSSTAPVLLIVNSRSLELHTGAEINGFVYLTGGNGDLSTIELHAGATSITGAIAAEGQLTTHCADSSGICGELTVRYDRPIMDMLRTTYGTWVRVTGGWQDFK